jgi:hypothetical protein
MSSVIETKDLGLAAFVKIRGYKLIGCENRVFKLESEESDLTRSEMEIEYSNSCCRAHDSAVMNLRMLLTPN